MDFYNLQENDHRLIEKTMSASPESQQYKDYFLRHFFNFDRLLNKKSILLVEEDPRIQRAMQSLILETNKDAVCWVANSIEDIAVVLYEKPCDLLIANYYQSEDEIDYEYWESIRAQYPKMDVIILSHMNDREYYNMLDKMADLDPGATPLPLSVRIKMFFENAFGG